MPIIKAFPKRPKTPQDLGALEGWLDLIWQLIKSDVYTPTLTNVTNLDGSTAFQCHYIRVGDVVHVAGKFQANPTAAAATELGMSLPIASNLLSADEQLAGTAFCPGVQQGAAIQADATNNRASINWVANDTANRAFQFTFTYRIIQ